MPNIEIFGLNNKPTPVSTDEIEAQETGGGVSVKMSLGAVISSLVAGVYQPISSVLTNTTASFTTALKTKLDGIEALADVTDTDNVTAAGALMDSEVDADIKTLALPANTTISAFGATLVDDADAATARTTLDVDAAGTDNSTDVTVTGEDFLSLTGQAITANPIDLDNLSATGTPSSSTYLRGDNTWAAVTAGTGDVTAAANLGDNLLIRGDGATKGVQNSSITIDDNDGVLGAGTVVENVAGATKTDFDLTDAGRTFIATGTTATWTIPANSSVAYPIGTVINIINSGSGLLTIAVTATDTLVSAGSLTGISVGAMATLVKSTSTEWHLAGGLE